jgi:hypothetical protein
MADMNDWIINSNLEHSVLKVRITQLFILKSIVI